MVDLYPGDRAGGMDRLSDARQAVDVPIAVDPELARVYYGPQEGPRCLPR